MQNAAQSIAESNGVNCGHVSNINWGDVPHVEKIYFSSFQPVPTQSALEPYGLIVVP